MTDNAQIEENVDLSKEVSPPATTHVDAVATESMLPQSKVNQLVGSAKQKGYDRAVEELRQQQAQLAQNQVAPQPVSDAATSGGNPDLNAMIDERLQGFQQQQMQMAQQQQAQAEANRILQEMQVKQQDAKDRYSDYDDKLSEVGHFRAVPEIYQYANMVDNGGDVLYDLANNPSKVATLKQLSDMDPQLAMKEISRLSNSIKQNQTAKNASNAPDPLRQVKSSNVGMDDGAMSLKDMKSRYRG